MQYRIDHHGNELWTFKLTKAWARLRTAARSCIGSLASSTHVTTNAELRGLTANNWRRAATYRAGATGGREHRGSCIIIGSKGHKGAPASTRKGTRETLLTHEYSDGISSVEEEDALHWGASPAVRTPALRAKRLYKVWTAHGRGVSVDCAGESKCDGALLRQRVLG